MLKKKTKFNIIGSIMLAILFLLVINTPFIAAGSLGSSSVESSTSGKQFANDSPPEKAIDSITERYFEAFGVNSTECISREINVEKGSLNTFGIKNITKCSEYKMKTGSNSMTVNDALTVFTGINNGYEYTAKFSFNNGSKYIITETENRITLKNEVTTITKQNITGSINYSMISIEKKTIGETINKLNDVHIELANSSGNFEVKISGESVWNRNESTILDATLTIDQNIREPIGQYLICLVPLNETVTKATLTLPNGTMLDPGMYQFVDESDVIYNNGYQASLYHLQGWIVQYTPLDMMNIGTLCQYLGIALTLFLGPVGIVAAIISIAILAVEQTYYQATDGNLYSYYESIFLEYWEFTGSGWQLTSSEPYYGELGFYTDRIFLEAKPYWAYYPTGGGDPHTNPWPGTGIGYFVVTSIAQYTPYGTGSIYNWDAMAGEADGNYARIYGPGSDGSGGVIIGVIYQSHGNIYVHCQASGDSTHFYVYTSNDFYNWAYKTDWLLPSGYSGWVYCSYSAGFNYICVSAIKQGSQAADLYIDSVAVID